MVGLTLDGVSLRLCGEPRRLRFDWNDMCELRKQYGPDFQDKINLAIAELDFETIAKTLSVSCRGELTVAQIMSDPPPIVASIRALTDAFNEAYHGPDMPKKVARPFVKAMAKLRLLISSWRPWRRG